MGVPRTITLTLRGWLLLGVFGAAMLLLLGGQFVFIVQQREIVDHQRDIAKRQEARAAPLLETGNALLGSREDAQRALREVGATIDTLRETLPELREALPGLREVLPELRAALPELRRHVPRLPEIVGAVEQTVQILERTYPTLRESLSVQHRTLGIGERSLGVQERTLAILEESMGIQRALLERNDALLGVAQETLAHVRSIDAKTGGPLPAAGGR